MNFNIFLKCDTCSDTTHCRIGMANRVVQPYRFACQTCGSPIDIVFDGLDSCDFKGAIEVHKESFETEENFVDLNLDFPVLCGEYVMGQTPFMVAVTRIGFDNYKIHQYRMNALNSLLTHYDDIKKLIMLYSTEKYDIYRTLYEKIFSEKVESLEIYDINSSLYVAIAKIFHPFLMPTGSVEAVNEYMEKIAAIIKKDKAAMDAFIEEIIDNNFLKNAQLDCLEIYPQILEAEVVLRPALFLDFDENYSHGVVPLRVSTENFLKFKDLYKDISEIMSRQLVLVGGINNLLKRGNHNSFKDIGKHTPKNLNKFADCTFGNKQNFLDDSWYDLSEYVADNQLRNSVAHYKVEYDEITQLITYYPKHEGMKQEKGETMYFLDFTRKILLSFREMHHLHQLIKCLFNYYFFMYKTEKT